MLLTPIETAIIMTAVEGELVTTRQVYYRLEMYLILGVKVGTALRIPEKEIEVYYDDVGKRGSGRRVNEFTKYFKHLGSSILLKSELSYDLPPDLFRAIKSVQEWRRTKLEDKQRKLNPLFGKTRNNQLEFNFAA